MTKKSLRGRRERAIDRESEGERACASKREEVARERGEVDHLHAKWRMYGGQAHPRRACALPTVWGGAYCWDPSQSNDVDPLETPYTGSTLDLIHGQVHPFHRIE